MILVGQEPLDYEAMTELTAGQVPPETQVKPVEQVRQVQMVRWEELVLQAAAEPTEEQEPPVWRGRLVEPDPRVQRAREV